MNCISTSWTDSPLMNCITSSRIYSLKVSWHPINYISISLRGLHCVISYLNIQLCPWRLPPHELCIHEYIYLDIPLTDWLLLSWRGLPNGESRPLGRLAWGGESRLFGDQSPALLHTISQTLKKFSLGLSLRLTGVKIEVHGLTLYRTGSGGAHDKRGGAYSADPLYLRCF